MLRSGEHKAGGSGRVISDHKKCRRWLIIRSVLLDVSLRRFVVSAAVDKTKHLLRLLSGFFIMFVKYYYYRKY